MLGMYGHSWASQYGTQPKGTAADTWAAALTGLTGPQIANGLQGCIAEGKEFPPGAPRFRAMCLGIPSLAQVKLALRPGGKRDGFTVLVWRHVDGFRLRAAGVDQEDRIIRDAYDLAREAVMRGEPIPPPPAAEVAHEKPDPKPRNPDVAVGALNELRSLFGAGASEDAPVSGKVAAAGPDV